MIVVFLGFVTEVRRNIHVNQIALVGLCSIHDADDPDELSLDVPQSEALFHDKLPAWRWYCDVDRNGFDAGECCSRDFNLYSGGIVYGARHRRDRHAVCVGDEPSCMDGKRLGEWLCAIVKWMECCRQYVPQ
jgi:hypothetical protein